MDRDASRRMQGDATGGDHLAAAVDADAVAGGSLSMTKSGVCSKRPSSSRTSLRQRRITRTFNLLASLKKSKHHPLDSIQGKRLTADDLVVLHANLPTVRQPETFQIRVQILRQFLAHPLEQVAMYPRL